MPLSKHGRGWNTSSKVLLKEIPFGINLNKTTSQCMGSGRWPAPSAGRLYLRVAPGKPPVRRCAKISRRRRSFDTGCAERRTEQETLHQLRFDLSRQNTQLLEGFRHLQWSRQTSDRDSAAMPMSNSSDTDSASRRTERRSILTLSSGSLLQVTEAGIPRLPKSSRAILTPAIWFLQKLARLN